MTDQRPHPPPLQGSWSNKRKLSQSSDWFLFVNGLLKWQAMNKMTFTVWTERVWGYLRVSPLAYIKIKLVQWHKNKSLWLLLLFFCGCIFTTSLCLSCRPVKETCNVALVFAVLSVYGWGVWGCVSQEV